MGVVGQFPLYSDMMRQTIRAPQNPMDKSTVFSIFPKRIEERKYTIDPGIFIIEPGSFEKPAILVVGPSSWWKEVDEKQPLLEISHSSIVIAESVIRDYANGLIACDMADNMPGLFFIPGSYATLEKAREYKNPDTGVTFDILLNEANRKQRNWFTSLVKMADALWARSSGNPLSISDDMRMAAREMNLISKDWYRDNLAVELVKCRACGTLRNPQFPVCPNCKAIDNPEKAKELGLVFAQ